MKIRFWCSYCHAKFKARREKAGQKVRCRRCGITVVIPKPNQALAKLTLFLKKASVNPLKKHPESARTEPLRTPEFKNL